MPPWGKLTQEEYRRDEADGRPAGIGSGHDGRRAEKSKTPISSASSYADIGEYWDNHDLNDYWEQTQPAEFEVDLRSSSIYFPLERNLAEQLRSAAEAHGVSPETLLNLWVQERVAEEPRPK
jgi:hypothetical protein